MELIVLIALGIVLGFFLLVFLGQVIALVVFGFAAILGIGLLILAISVVSEMSPEDAQAFGILLLVILAMFVTVDIVKLITYWIRVAEGKARIRRIKLQESVVDDISIDDLEKLEVSASQFGMCRVILKRHTDIGWVTIDGADHESTLRDLTRRSVIANVLFRKRHRFIQHRSLEDFLVGRRARRLAREERLTREKSRSVGRSPEK
jgi:hypothetical protein